MMLTNDADSSRSHGVGLGLRSEGGNGRQDYLQQWTGFWVMALQR